LDEGGFDDGFGFHPDPAMDLAMFATLMDEEERRPSPRPEGCLGCALPGALAVLSTALFALCRQLI
jgi:hypothetical protein